MTLIFFKEKQNSKPLTVLITRLGRENPYLGQGSHKPHNPLALAIATSLSVGWRKVHSSYHDDVKNSEGKYAASGSGG